jgi:two-component system NarL family response regulator
MNILLVDDHPLFLEGIRNLLAVRNMTVVGTAYDGGQALQQARALRPDVILMDIQMPVCDGLEATRLIKAELPDVQIVMLTMSESDDHLFEAIRSGATGYLNKTLDSGQFFDLLTALSRGEAPLAPGIAARLLSEFAQQEQRPHREPAATNESDDDVPDTLTERQQQVLALVAQGHTYKEVGTMLHLSERTIKYHMQEIVRRLHLKNRVDLIAYARRVGLDSPPSVERESQARDKY